MKKIKRCPRKVCALYPEFCPDASNSGSYKMCVILSKKEEKKLVMLGNINRGNE